MGTVRGNGAVPQSNAADSGERPREANMSSKKLTARRLVSTVLTATIVSVPLVALTTTTEAHAVKCIPGSGNPLNPCP
jgi:hypothetical protein